MALLQVVNLNREAYRIILDRLPSDGEWQVLDTVARGLDRLLAGEEITDPKFLDILDYLREQPEFQEAMLRYAPAAARTQ